MAITRPQDPNNVAEEKQMSHPKQLQFWEHDVKLSSLWGEVEDSPNSHEKATMNKSVYEKHL